jgi:arylsulfatase A-like enzyme
LLARKSASEVNEEFLDWLDRGGDKPWFAFLNYFDAHEPYLPRAPFKGEYSNGLPRRRFDQFRYWPMEVGINDWTALTPAEVEAERAAYEESITAVDAQLGALLNALQRSGALARTIVVITADHGEQFGEHEAFGHGNTLQWRSIHVPLVVSWPGHLPEGARVSLPVSLRDLPATILSLTLPSGERLPGTPFLGEDAAIAPSPLVLAEAQRSPGWGRPFSLHAVIGKDWLYINAEQGPEHVYHVGRDWYDSLMTDPVRRAAIIQLGRSRLAEAARAESARALRTAARR